MKILSYSLIRFLDEYAAIYGHKLYHLPFHIVGSHCQLSFTVKGVAFDSPFLVSLRSTFSRSVEISSRIDDTFFIVLRVCIK